MSILLLIFISIVIYLLYLVYTFWKKQRKTNTNGNGWTGIINPRRFISEELYKVFLKDKSKEFVHFWMGPVLVMAPVHPDAVKFVLKSNDFIKHQLGVSKNGYYIQNFGKNLVSVNGDDWKRQRSFVNSGFNTKAYNEYFPTFFQMTEKVITKMEDDSKKGDIDIHDWLTKFTIDLLGNSIFHHDFGRLDSKSGGYYRSYLELLKGPGRLILFFPWLESSPYVRRFQEAGENIKSLFNDMIKERQKKDRIYGDILDNLLNSQTEGTAGLSKTELISNLWIFFTAGHETTASALTFECVCLAKYPDIQEKVYQEIQNTIGDKEPTLDDLSKLTYLDCFIHEVMRLHPSIQLIRTRTCTQDVKYKDYVIPKDSVVSPFIYGVHKHPDFWPDPEKFDPDRFSVENRKGSHHYAYLPFSLGPRQCIGNIFSLIEQRLLLTRLLQKFRVLPPKDSPLFNDTTLRFGEVAPVQICLEKR